MLIPSIEEENENEQGDVSLDEVSESENQEADETQYRRYRSFKLIKK